MNASLIDGEPLLRLVIFAILFAILAAAEALAPRRTRSCPRLSRWMGNFSVLAVDIVVVRLVFPLAAVGIALMVEERGWGLLPALEMPAWFAVPLAVVVLDLAIYVQHVIFHAVPVLWRVHRMHHADLDFDLTTGFRFHPIEILLSMLIKMALIVGLGPDPLAVLVFEVTLSTTSLFNHSNLGVPVRIDRWLRLVLVTPDMHRVHHSIERDETDSNFGFNLPWWDRLFGTYHDQPRAGHAEMRIGIGAFRDPRTCMALAGMLMIPFRSSSGENANGGEDG